MDYDEQRRRHEEDGPLWWVYEIFPELSREECDAMIREWKERSRTASRKCDICGETWCGETMCIYSPTGTEVVYLNRNGYEINREEANKWLKEGETYIVENIDLGDSHSYVRLRGFEPSFNTVMFGKKNAKSS